MRHRFAAPLIIASLASLGTSLAQEEKRPEPPQPPPSEQRPPLPPQELRDRPDRPDRTDRETDRRAGDRGERPDRPDRPFAPDRRDADRPRPEGRPPGDRRPDGPREPGEGRRIERFRESRREPMEHERKPTPYIGVVSLPVPPALSAQLSLEEGFGLVVENVLPDSPAQTAGVQRYDILKQLNDQQLVSPDQLARLIGRVGKDGEATLTILRKGQDQKLTVKVAEKLLSPRSDESMRFPGFGMGGSDRSMGREQLEELRRRMQEMGGREGSDAMRDMREMQERMRAYQESMRHYREKLREWQKNPGSEMPQMPELPGEPNQERRTRPGQPGVRPADLLREMRPGDRPEARTEWSEGSSRWDATRARVKMRDSDGEIEIGMNDGKRVLTVKNPQGDVVFTGPVDSPKEREAIPERVRRKLEAMAPPQPPPTAINEPRRPPRVGPPPPRLDREAEVQ